MSKIKPRFQIDLPDVNVLVALFDPAHVFHALSSRLELITPAPVC